MQFGSILGHTFSNTPLLIDWSPYFTGWFGWFSYILKRYIKYILNIKYKLACNFMHMHGYT